MSKKFFDNFTFHARVMPVIVLLLPLIALGILKKVIHTEWTESTILISFSLVFLTITSKIARNLGKQFENQMYKQLGAKPTTIVLRFSDKLFDNVTKQRYHKKLNAFDGLNLPMNKEDETLEDDDQYNAAANILRNYANLNREKEYRVYQELKEYNFWRNLYGTKRFAIAIYSFIAIREIVMIKKFDIKQIFLQPYPNYVVFIIMLLFIVFIILFINQRTVEQKAFDYAKTLVEVCERI